MAHSSDAGAIKRPEDVPTHLEVLRANIVKKVATRSGGVIDDTNHGLMLTLIMRDLNKQKLAGIHKQELAVGIMSTCLDVFGVDDISTRMTLELIAKSAELIYQAGYHRRSTTRGKSGKKWIPG